MTLRVLCLNEAKEVRRLVVAGEPIPPDFLASWDATEDEVIALAENLLGPQPLELDAEGIPEGRERGDCWLCCGDPTPCDCLLGMGKA